MGAWERKTRRQESQLIRGFVTKLGEGAQPPRTPEKLVGGILEFSTEG